MNKMFRYTPLLLLAVLTMNSLIKETTGQGLSIRLGGTVYSDGDYVLVTDIRSNIGDGSGEALICDTSQVNTECCRSNDNPMGTQVGEWFFPDGTQVTSFSKAPQDAGFIRDRMTEEVRLFRNMDRLSPVGLFRCEVPDMADPPVNHTISINIGLVALDISPSGEGIAGQPFTLTCSVTLVQGQSVDSIEWLSPTDVVIPTNNVNPTVTTGTTSSVLRFTPLTQGGNYTCRVTAGSSTLNKSYTIPYNLSIRLGNVVLSDGDYVVITDIRSNIGDGSGEALICDTSQVNTECCTSEDNPNGTKVGEWIFPNGTLITSFSKAPPDAGFVRDRMTEEVRLFRNRDALSPTGLFRCEVPDMADSSMIHTISINIGPAVSVTVTERSGSENAYFLLCTVNGADLFNSNEISYQWRTDEDLDGQTSDTLSFEPLMESDAGNYTCQITITSNVLNAPIIRNGSFTVNVSPVDAPLTPQVLTATNVYTNRATISWTTSRNTSTPETYVVSYGLSADMLNLNSTILNSITGVADQQYSVQLTQLMHFTTYWYQVISTNTYATTLSPVMSFITLELPPSAVVGLNLVALNITSLQISWQGPANPNGVILHFNVSVTSLTSNSLVFDQVIGADIFTAKIYDLEPGVPYSVAVVALNSAGSGADNIMTTFTQELSPNIAPRNVRVERVSDATMTVSWDALTLSQARGFVTSYTVSYQQVDLSFTTQQASRSIMVDSDQTTVMIDGLEADVIYSVQVYGNTVTGAGIGSEIIFAELPATSGNNIGITVGIIVAVLVILVAGIIAAVFIVIFVIRYKKESTNTSSTSVKMSNLERARTYSQGPTELSYDYVEGSKFGVVYEEIGDPTNPHQSTALPQAKGQQTSTRNYDYTKCIAYESTTLPQQRSDNKPPVAIPSSSGESRGQQSKTSLQTKGQKTSANDDDDYYTNCPPYLTLIPPQQRDETKPAVEATSSSGVSSGVVVDGDKVIGTGKTSTDSGTTL